MPKVSVLMAVYNAEPYLSQALDSLLGQTLTDIQVVCIDDCSTDRSLDILNSYAMRDQRIEVIHLDENQGQAHARNVGLKYAKGEYTCMLDADDWFSADALALAVSAFQEQTDCVLFDVVISRPDKEEVYSLPPFDTISGEEAFRLSLSWQIHGLYMIRTALHQQHPYDESCRLYSDDNTTRIHYLSSRNLRHCKGRYYYRQHSASSTNQVSVRRFDYLRANESMRNQMIALNVGRELLNLYENCRWMNLIHVYMFYHVHAHELSVADRSYGRTELRRTWESIDQDSLDTVTTAKFGYRHCGTWNLFRLQEWVYFTLRGLLGRNK